MEQTNMALFKFMNQYAGLNPFIDNITIIAAKYMPLIFIIWLIYFWIKKGDKHKNIVLYSIYAAILGLTINFAVGIFYFHPRPLMIPVGTLLFPVSAGNSFPSNYVTFMLSVALIMTYFKETRKAGVTLIILGLIEGFTSVFCGVNFPFDIFGSILVAIISTVIIYSFRKKFVSLNQIFRLIYQILK